MQNKSKFIYTEDAVIYEAFMETLDYVGKFNKDNKEIYIFENNGKITFSDIELEKVSFGNKMCF